MKKQFAPGIAAAIAFGFTVLSAFAGDVYVADKPHSEAKFEIQAFLDAQRHMEKVVSGKFHDVAATVNTDPANASASSVDFSIKAASIDTDNENRDKNLRSGLFFDVEKFPEITFKSTAIKPTAKKNVYAVTGDLTMHGVTKRVTLPVEFLGFGKDPGGNTRAGFTVKTTLDRKDYGINWNKILDKGGVLLGDDVNVIINLETVKQKPAAPQAAAK
jgi:polyisoprenoid-binding protein YceI